MSQQSPERSLHRKLTEVMASVDWQKKRGRNTQQNYDFVTAEQIKDAVRGALAEKQVMVYTSVKGVDRSEWQTKGGTTMFSVFIQGEVTFADGESGEMFTVEAAGEGMDSGDKALNKAQTAMVKYALINTFLIPTGDDPEQDSPEVTTRAQKPTQASRKPQETPKPTQPTPSTPELSDDDWQGLVPEATPEPLGLVAEGNGHKLEGLSARDLFSRLEEKGIDRRVASDTAKKLFGRDKWSLKDHLTDEERALVWEEITA